MSIKTKQIFITIVCGLLPFVIISTIAVGWLSRLSENERYVSSYYNTQNIASTLNSTILNFNEMSYFLIGNQYVREFLTTTEQENSVKYNLVYNDAQRTLALLPFGSSALHGIGVYALDGRSVISGADRLIALTEDERKRALDSKGKWFWSTDEDRLAICRLLRDTGDVSSVNGFVKISINKDAFRKLFVTDESWPSASFLFLDRDSGNSLLSSADDLDIPMEKLTLEGTEGRLHHNGTDYYVMQRELQEGKGALICLTPALTDRYNDILLRMVLGAMVIVVLLIAIQLYLLNKWIIRPIQKLGGLMQSIGSEDFSVKFRARGKDEIAILAGHFNLMSEKLGRLYNEVYQSRLRMKDAEIKALQSELNPHFLFNTLNTIYLMATGGDPKTAGMIQDLSVLFRISMYRTQDGLVPLETELDHVRTYLSLQKMRLQAALTYSIDIEELPDDLVVVKLVLQPLVENAILHGIAPAKRGEIIVSVYIQDSDLVYSVYDNGVGAEPGRIEALLNESAEDAGIHGKALRNVNAILRLKFGGNYGLSCKRPADGGTIFIVRQPVIHRREETEDANAVYCG